MVFFMLWIARVLGFFPYHISSQPAKATLSYPLLMYSLVLTMAVLALLTTQQMMYLPIMLSVLHGTRYLVQIFMTLSILILMFLAPFYYLWCSRTLARALASLMEFHNKQLSKFIEGKLDKRALFHLVLVLLFAMTLLFTSIKPNIHCDLNISSFIAIFYDLPMRFFVVIVYNALFRLLSLMLAAAFTPVEKLYWKLIPECSFDDLQVSSNHVKVLPWADNRAAGEQPRYKYSHDNETKVPENTNKESKSSKRYCENSMIHEHIVLGTFPLPLHQQDADALLFARYRVRVIERLEATITRVLAPVICFQLLLECILNVTFLLSIQPDHPRLFINHMVYLGIGMLRAYLLLDAPEDYRRKVRKVLHVRRLSFLEILNTVVPRFLL